MVYKLRFIIFFQIIALFLLSCDSKYVPYYAQYIAEFNKQDIVEIKKIIKSISDKNNLEYYEMNTSTDAFKKISSSTFYITVNYKNNPIINITNMVTENILRLNLTDWGELPIETLNAVSFELINELALFGLEVEKIQSQSMAQSMGSDTVLKINPK